ncbi:MAG TPA: hypothetical protein VGB00_15710, partial [Pyrinomonadaceae bacterium]
YDFLRGDEAYKFDWASRKTELLTVSLSRRTPAALAHEGINRAWLGFRNFSKSALPSGLAETLKSRRREWKRNRRLTNLKPENSREVYES